VNDASEPVIEAVGLTKTFRDFWMRERVTAVAQLDLRIEPRQVFGLLGPNGSGKSTTIKMILGLLFPTRGRITVFGKRPTDVAVKARIGFLPEESYLYPFLDARETLDYYGRLFHQPRSQRRHRIDMLLDMVGLSGVAYRRVGEYSKGMQRRIGLAQALINDPDLLILDEPTSGMDPIGTRQFKDLIQTLAARGKTVLLSSHLLADVEDVCQSVCVLYGGKRRAQGDIDQLLAKRQYTQLTTPHLDDATLERVRAMLAAQGLELLEVGAPRDRLENLFLRIVQEARDSRLATGGAAVGSGVAQFLRQPEGASVIEELVATAQPSPPPQRAAPPQAPASGATRIDDLLAPRKASPTPAADTPAPPDTSQADKKVLDELLGKPPEAS
jgi:ABC-2 type transport system ATP-binding protein